MLRKLKLLSIVILAVLSHQAMGQDLLQKANTQYRFKQYAEAINTYEEFLQKNPDNVEAKINLADSYRVSNDLVSASKLYEKLVSVEAIQPKVIKNYGLTLMKMGKYNAAKQYFQTYRAYDAKEGEHYSLSCDYAKDVFEKPSQYDVDLLPINTSSSDFGVSFFNDKLIFSSFRNDLVAGSENAQALNGNILYISDIDESLTIANVRFLRSGISERINIGPVSYSNTGVVIFARNKIKDGGAHVTGDDGIHSLYVAEVKESGDWQNERSFRYNEFGTSTAFPSLSSDGTTLYFASNRAGGFGGYDIYVSHYRDNEWSYPENLGPSINTKGNEITPFFDGETLYFASDYTHGMGGYDIFSSAMNNGTWSYPNNLGNGVNSSGDDYYPMMKKGSEVLLFSSNRLGGKGMDDLYSAIPVKQEELAMETPMERQLPEARMVSNTEVTKVTLLNATTPVKPVLATPVKNTTETTIVDGKTYKSSVQVESDGSIVESINVSPATTAKKIEKLDKPEAYDLSKNVVKNSKSAPFNLDISKARRVAINELLPASKVYFIQLAALYNTSADVERFRNLKQFGNIYKVYKSNSTKIKLGYFYERSEAKSVLDDVKSYGYTDAFITRDDLDSRELELIISKDSYTDTDYTTTSTYTPNTSVQQYKIRLASYEDPIWFDVAKAKNLGQIEQWTKGGWTIFILSGYASYEDAESARIRAVNQGFRDAEVVLDNDGILERLKLH